MAKTWHIVILEAGRELDAHELFENAGAECWTPFEILRQKQTHIAKMKRIPSVPYAKAIWQGYLIFTATERFSVNMAISLCKDKKWLYRLSSSSEGYIHCYADHRVQTYKDFLKVKSTKPSFRNLVTRGYDKAKDSRKRRNKLYAQTPLVLPDFDVGEPVKFIAGPFESFEGIVLEQRSEDAVVVIQHEIMGRAVKTEVMADKIDRVA